MPKLTFVLATLCTLLLFCTGVAGASMHELLSDDFSTANGPNDLITNEYAFWSSDALGVRSPNWEVTSGSLFSKNGIGWSGRPDAITPIGVSLNGNGSYVFRMRTKATHTGSARQEVSARINGFGAGTSTRPPTAWDGVVLWPRYVSETNLYFAYMLRRDGRVAITKKCDGKLPGGGYYNDGTYFGLTAERHYADTVPGTWYRLATEAIDNPDGSVTIRIYRDGQLAAEATDSGTGCAPIRGTARLGIRADNTDFNIKDYTSSGTIVKTAPEATVTGASGDDPNAAAPAPPSSASAPPPPFAPKLEIARASVLGSERRLSVLAPITGRASGEVKAVFRAAGQADRFDAEIDADKRRVLINRRISAAQARLGTGILTLTYDGDADTQPQEVRLRAASRPANLAAGRPRISNGLLLADGEISRRARGVVRLQLLYEPAGQQTRTLQFTARISNGRYRFNERLPADVLAGIAQRRGVVHSYTLFTGYFANRVRGEMSSFQVLPAR